MTPPARVFVDLDDVLAETTRTLLDCFAEHFGRRLELEQVVSFDLAVSLGIDAETYTRFMQLVHDDAVLFRMAPRRDAEAVLSTWHHAGCEISVMTGRPPSTATISRRWLSTHRMPHHRLGFVDKYGRPDWRGGDEPAIPLEELPAMGFDLVVEDSLRTAAFLAERLDVPVVLMDRPWNRDLAALPERTRERIVRCRDWSDVAERFPRPVRRSEG